MEEIKKIRKETDNFDHHIIKLLVERMDLVPRIVNCKKGPTEDKNRENDLMSNRKDQSDLDDNFIEALFGLIMAESRRLQRKLKDEISKGKK